MNFESRTQRRRAGTRPPPRHNASTKFLLTPLLHADDPADAVVSSLVYDSHVRGSDDSIAHHLVAPSRMATESHKSFLAHQDAHHEHVTHYGERRRAMDFLEDEDGEIGGHDGVVGGRYL